MALTIDQSLQIPENVDHVLSAEEVIALAKGIDPDSILCHQKCRFQDGRYARNVVFCNDFLEVCILCWKPGQQSDIHDHGDSHCLYVICQGRMTEDVYDRPPAPEDATSFDVDGNPMPAYRETKHYDAGAFILQPGEAIHRVRNESADPDDLLVSLHLYSRPLTEKGGRRWFPAG